MIKISGLKKVYSSELGNITALEEVNLDIKKGEIFGIIGLSGAGKSTLIRCLNLLEKPTEGSIEIAGLDITTLGGKELRALRSSLGMIFQHFNLLMQRTVEDNVAFPLEIAKVPRKDIKNRVKELLELVGLSEKAKSHPAQLSGGQKQRVAIARALANNPKLLLCDEATSALDPLTTKSILALLKDINQKLGLTIVLITHEMAVIKEICDSVAVIDNARIVETGNVIELIKSPKTEAARKLIGSPTYTAIREEKTFHQDESEYSMRVKVIFTGEAAVKPVISTMVLNYKIYANILFGNIDHIQGKVFGELVLELTGEKDSVRAALGYMQDLNLHIEELNS